MQVRKSCIQINEMILFRAALFLVPTLSEGCFGQVGSLKQTKEWECILDVLYSGMRIPNCNIILQHRSKKDGASHLLSLTFKNSLPSPWHNSPFEAEQWP